MKKLLIINMLFLSACSQKFYTLNPQSHFDYPNSNIQPISSVTGTVSEMYLGMGTSMSGELERLAIEDALRKQVGADILVNYIGETKYTNLLILPLTSVTYTVYGTAAKMEIGKQYLH